jgi:lipopolysaccharide/colanic/teichoic acid biosynthesis glycosyltransferase
MAKKLLFYTGNFILIAFSVIFSVYLYWQNSNLTVKFLKQHQPSLLMMIITIYILTYLFDIYYYSSQQNSKDWIKMIVSIFFRVFLMLMITAFIHFFLFINIKIGRFIYLYTLIQLTIYFSVENLLNIHHKIQFQFSRIKWLSDIPIEKIKQSYALNLPESKFQPTSTQPHLIIYDYPPNRQNNLQELLCYKISGTRTIDTISFIEEIAECIPIDYIDEYWLLYNLKNKDVFYERFKRLADVIVSFFLLIILFPVGFLFALIHFFSSPGSLFYCQDRLGKKGIPFKIVKFRTMIRDAEKQGPQFAKKKDPRITAVGNLMRKFRIDEVPQLINVLKGDMSMIGPRPERSVFVEKLEKDIPFYRLRLEVKPGLTGWSQINIHYAGADLADQIKKLEYDFYYIKNRNLILDIKILIKTIKTMLYFKGR